MPDHDPVVRLLRDAGTIADRDSRDPIVGREVRERVLRNADAGAPPTTRRRRPPRWLVVVAATTALGGGSFATASVLRGPQLAPEEIDSFAKDGDVPRDVARRKLVAQSRLPALAEAARARLGDAFGGVRVDNPGDLRIKLALVAGATPETVADARDVITDVRLSGEVDLETVRLGERTLQDLQAKIDDELAGVNRGAKVRVEVEPDPKGGRLLVRRTKPVTAATPAQRRYLSTVRDRYGAAVVLRDGLGTLRLDIAPGRAEAPPDG